MDIETFDEATEDCQAVACILIQPDGRYEIFCKGRHAELVGLVDMLTASLHYQSIKSIEEGFARLGQVDADASPSAEKGAGDAE